MSSAPSRRVNVGTQQHLRLDPVRVQAPFSFDKMLVSGQCTGDMYPVVWPTEVEKHYNKTIHSLFATIVHENLPESKRLIDYLENNTAWFVKCVKYNQLSPSKSHGENNITLGPPESLFDEGDNKLFVIRRVDINGKPRWAV